MDIIEYIDGMQEELSSLRRDFHRYPELPWREIRTSSKIAAYLTELGYEVLIGEEVCSEDVKSGVPDEETMASELQRAIEQGADMRFADKMSGGRTGVIGILKCGEGPTVSLRYDIDALPILEDSSEVSKAAREDYISRNPGVMHACGHDSHITLGLGTAKAIAQIKNRMHGTVKFIFQPAEEGVYGAKTIVAKGHLDGVDYSMGAHIGGNTETEPGVLLFGSGATLATFKFDADFYGRASHAGVAPNEGRNAILAAAVAVQNLHAISRHGGGDTRVNVGKIYGGDGRNVIAPFAHIEGEVRGTTQESINYMQQAAEKVILSAADMHGCTVDIRYMGSAGVNQNSPELTARLLEICRKNGLNAVDAGEQKPKASEDYAEISRYVRNNGGQSCYFNICSRCTTGVHQSKFDFDETVLPIGVKAYTLAVMDLLK